jgi:hypothetical protein
LPLAATADAFWGAPPRAGKAARAAVTARLAVRGRAR